MFDEWAGALSMSARLLSEQQLLGLMDKISNPKRHGLTQRALDQSLIDFCAGCPDPVRARWLIAENPEPMSDQEIVGQALSMPYVNVADVPKSVVPANHPARR
jgi:hypothetical protein